MFLCTQLPSQEGPVSQIRRQNENGIARIMGCVYEIRGEGLHWAELLCMHLNA